MQKRSKRGPLDNSTTTREIVYVDDDDDEDDVTEVES